MRQIILCSSRCVSLVVGVMYPSSVGIVELRISLGLTGVRTRDRGGAARSVPWGSGGRALEGLDAPPARLPHCELPVPHHPRGRNASEPARRGPQGVEGPATGTKRSKAERVIRWWVSIRRRRRLLDHRCCRPLGLQSFRAPGGTRTPFRALRTHGRTRTPAYFRTSDDI